MKKIHWFTDQDAKISSDNILYIQNKEVIKQIQKVLRLDVGESVVIRTGDTTMEGTLAHIIPSEIQVSDIKEIKSVHPQKQVSLFVCIPKKDKFELILEKCTEIGITNFYPVLSDRTIKTNINFERAEKIIMEASEQAQRTDTPVLHQIRSLEEIVKEFRPVVFDVEGEKYTGRSGTAPTGVLIGPEGGFSEKELAFFKQEKLDIYTLQTPVLKTETAAIVVSGLLLN